MVKLAAGTVMVPLLQPLFMQLCLMFVECFLETLNATLMTVRCNLGNGISNNRK